MLVHKPVIVCGPDTAKLDSPVSLVEAATSYVAKKGMLFERFAIGCFLYADYVLRLYSFFHSTLGYVEGGGDLFGLIKVLNIPVTSDPRDRI